MNLLEQIIYLMVICAVSFTYCNIYSTLVLQGDSQNTKVCDEFNITGEDSTIFEWPAITKRFWLPNVPIESIPKCVDNNLKLVTKVCMSNGTWFPPQEETKCYQRQKELMVCPPGFIHVEEIESCIYVTSMQSGPPRCPYPRGNNYTIDYLRNISNYLQEHVKMTEIWLPVERNISNGLRVFEYLDKTVNKPTNQLKFHDFYIPPLEEGNCMSYNIAKDEYSSKKRPCNHTLPSICIYKVFYSVFNKDVNDRCYYTIDNANDCYYLKNSTGNPQNICEKLAEPKHSHQMSLLIKLHNLDDNYNTNFYWFGLKNEVGSNKIFMGASPLEDIEYTNWGRRTNYSNRYGIFDFKGKWNFVEPDSSNSTIFGACQTKITKNLSPHLELKNAVGSSDHILLLYRTSKAEFQNETEEPICFTNADFENDSASVTFDCIPHPNEPVKQYKVQVNKYPAQYWCYVYSHNYNHTTSNTLTVFRDNLIGNSRTYDYVLYVTIICNLIKPTESRLLQYYVSVVDKYFKRSNLRNFTSMKTRLMKIFSKREIIKTQSVGEVDLVMHLTVSLNDTEENVYELLSKIIANISKSEMNLFTRVGGQIIANNSNPKLKITDLLGSQHCFSWESSSKDNTQLTRWTKTDIGKTRNSSSQDEICWDNNGNLVRTSMECYGGFVHGGRWRKANGTCSDKRTSQTAHSLLDILNRQPSTKSASSRVSQAASLTTQANQTLDDASVKLISRILDSAANESGTNAQDALQLVSNVADSEEETLEKAQQDCSAEKILGALDSILLGTKEEAADFETPNVIAKIISLNSFNSSIITFTTPGDPSSKTGEPSNRKLSVTDEMGTDADVNVAIFVPDAVLEHGRSMSQGENNPASMVASIFMKDSLFRDPKAEKRVASDVVLLAMNGVHKLPQSVEIRFKPKQGRGFVCAFWNYSIDRQGFWQEESNAGIQDAASLVECKFDHLTHFAILVTDTVFDEKHISILEYITVSGCGISALSIVAIFVTAVKFASWRNDTGHKILLQFSLIVLMKYVLLFVSSSDSLRNSYDALDVRKVAFCKLVATLLHYVIMAEFCWMLVIAVLQYRRFVLVISAQVYNVYLIASLFSWFFPAVPVAMVLFANIGAQDTAYSSKICYLSGLYMYLLILTPIALIIFVNSIILVLILVNIRRSQIQIKHYSHSDQNLTIAIIRLGVFLFFLLGLTWIFGLLVALSDHLVFVYLFCITGTLQGFVMFLFFVAWNDKTKHLWYSFIINVTKYLTTSITNLCYKQGQYNVYEAMAVYETNNETESTLTEGNSKFYVQANQQSEESSFMDSLSFSDGPVTNKKFNRR